MTQALPSGDQPNLKTEERLILHQLRLLEWLDARSERKKDQGTQDGEQSTGVAIPRRWTLTQGVTLYEWQEECLRKWFDTNCRGTVKVVTGGGKTLLALAAAERLQERVRDLRVAIVVPTIVLMHQWFEEILERGNLTAEAIGRLGGGYKDTFSHGRRVLICVLATAYKELPKLVKRARVGSKLLLVADECHRFGATELSQVLSTERAYSIGLSATPERDDNEPENPEGDYDQSLLGRELGPIIYDFSLADALKLGVVPMFTIHHYGLPLSPEERSRYELLSRSISDSQSELRNHAPDHAVSGSGFFQWVRRVASKGGDGLGTLASRLIGDISRRKELLYRIEARSEAVEDLLRSEFDVNPEARVILFHESIEEVMRLFVRLKDAGFPAIAEHSELPTSIREVGLNLFRKGIARVIVSAKSLIEGFNVPAVDVGIIVASSSSVRQRVQSMGRVLRKHRGSSGEEKTSCIHVLYAKDTVDDAIYGKESWDHITGIDRNIYFDWAPGSNPLLQEGPPRAPLPVDTEVDPEALQQGCVYPGQYEGQELTCDTKGNIRDAEGRYARDSGPLAEAVYAIKGSYGRFRVTPHRQYVLVRVADGDEWTTRYVTRLDSPVGFESDKEELQEPDKAEIGEWAEKASVGDPYPFTSIPVVLEDLKFKSKRGGVISKHIPGGEVFARVGGHANDPERGEDAARLVDAVRRMAAVGRPVSRLEINEINHVLFREGGKAYFICSLRKGLEFPV